MVEKKLTTVRLDPVDAAALARARKDGLSASELVRRGLRVVAARYYAAGELLEPCEQARASPRYDAWLRERTAFERLEPRLTRYFGQWVAVHGGKVVDSDRDEDALFDRVWARVRGGDFFMGRVGAPPDVVDMPGFDIHG